MQRGTDGLDKARATTCSGQKQTWTRAQMRKTTGDRPVFHFASFEVYTFKYVARRARRTQCRNESSSASERLGTLSRHLRVNRPGLGKSAALNAAFFLNRGGGFGAPCVEASATEHPHAAEVRGSEELPRWPLQASAGACFESAFIFYGSESFKASLGSAKDPPGRSA